MHLLSGHFTYVMPLSGLLKVFNDIQFIQKLLHGVILEKIMIAHSLLDKGKEDKSQKLDKELAVEILILRWMSAAD